MCDVAALEELEVSGNSSGIELDAVSFENDSASGADVVYPSMLLDGVSTEEEFYFFRKREPKDKECAIPLYCTVEGKIAELGLIEISVDSLLFLRSVSDYEVSLMYSEDKKIPINLEDPETAAKFIRL